MPVPRISQFMGYNSRVPASLGEFYQQSENRFINLIRDKMKNPYSEIEYCELMVQQILIASSFTMGTSLAFLMPARSRFGRYQGLHFFKFPCRKLKHFLNFTIFRKPSCCAGLSLDKRKNLTVEYFRLSPVA